MARLNQFPHKCRHYVNMAMIKWSLYFKLMSTKFLMIFHLMYYENFLLAGKNTEHLPLKWMFRSQDTECSKILHVRSSGNTATLLSAVNTQNLQVSFSLKWTATSHFLCLFYLEFMKLVLLNKTEAIPQKLLASVCFKPLLLVKHWIIFVFNASRKR
jgi:hypothetical protein